MATTTSDCRGAQIGVQVASMAIDEGSYRGQLTGQPFDVQLRLGRMGRGGRLENVSGDVFGADGVCQLSFIGRSSQIAEAASGVVEGPITVIKIGGAPSGPASISLRQTELGDLDAQFDFGDGPYAARLTRTGSYLRSLKVIVDGVAGLPVPDGDIFTAEDQPSMRAALRGAGLDADIDVRAFDADVDGKSSFNMAELEATMHALTRDDPQGPWRLHVLFCPAFDGRDGPAVNGIMYDIAGPVPRQGVAIFLNAQGFQRHQLGSPDWRREVRFALLHEIGHALNLPHCFEDGRPKALSFMNYPGSVAGGEAAFWRDFADCYDEPELGFLRHAPFMDIAVGQSAYSSRITSLVSGGGWPALAHGFDDGCGHETSSSFKISVEPLKRAYAVGEPVFLKVTLTNVGARAALATKSLDPSDGLVRITVRGPRGDVRRLLPLARLCQKARRKRLAPGQSISFDGVLASFSADGPLFTEPGAHEVQAAFLGAPGAPAQASAVVRILHPTRAEELFAIDIWDDNKLQRAIYHRQPLLALDPWRRIREKAATLAADDGNSSADYLTYISGMGWTQPFAPLRTAQRRSPDLARARRYFQDVASLGALPEGARRRCRFSRARR